jgi:hypothetical protein
LAKNRLIWLAIVVFCNGLVSAQPPKHFTRETVKEFFTELAKNGEKELWFPPPMLHESTPQKTIGEFYRYQCSTPTLVIRQQVDGGTLFNIEYHTPKRIAAGIILQERLEKYGPILMKGDTLSKVADNGRMGSMVYTK